MEMRVEAEPVTGKLIYRGMRLVGVTAMLLLCAMGVQGQTVEDHIRAAQAELTLALTPINTDYYHGLSDTSIRLKPAAPVAVVGTPFLDPTFGSRMWRVTDANTRSGLSVRVQSSAHAASWNATGTEFLVMAASGETLTYGFDGSKITAIPNTVTSQIEPSFSFVDAELIYGAVIHKIKSWRVDTGVAADVFNFDATYATLPLTDTYIGGFQNADNDVWVAFFGGTSQDRHVFVHHSVAGLLDLRSAGYKIHGISMDRTGRYVFIYAANDPNLGRLAPGVAAVNIWDTQTGVITKVVTLPNGHDSQGYGVWVNADCCSGGTWDAGQWQIRTLPGGTPSNLIPSVLTPQEIYLAEHTNWRAAKANVAMPIISANYRYGAGMSVVDYPWRARDEEIIAIATDGTGKVWRFAHTQSIVGINPEFWAEPIVNCTPDGRHCIFTSNWGVASGRQDVFLVELK